MTELKDRLAEALRVRGMTASDIIDLTFGAVFGAKESISDGQSE